MSMLQRSFAARLACALALVAAAALLRYALEPWLGGNAAFLLFAPAILARLIEHYVNRPAVTGQRLDRLCYWKRATSFVSTIPICRGREIYCSGLRKSG